MSKYDHLSWVRYLPIHTGLSQVIWVRYIGAAKDPDHILTSGVYITLAEFEQTPRQLRLTCWTPLYKTPIWLQELAEANINKVAKSHYWECKKRREFQDEY